MGLLKKLLLGPVLGADKRPQMPSYLRDTNDSYERKSRFHKYHCIFCGKIITVSGVPNARTGGPCSNSPFGTHRWEEI